MTGKVSFKSRLLVIGLTMFVLGGVSSVFAGGQQESTSIGDMTIEMWAWGRLCDRVQKHTVPIFTKIHPDVEFKGVTMNEDDIIQKILNLVQTGSQVPDIIFANDHIAPIYMSNSVVIPINEPKQLIDMSQFVPYKVANASWKGTVYGVPHDPAPVVRIYRKDLYEKTGVDPESVKTWDNFIETGNKLRAIDTYAWNLPREGMWFQFFQIVLNSLGGHVYDKNLEVAIDSPETVEALGILKRMKDAGITNDYGNDRSQGWFAALQQGKLANVMHASWYVGSAVNAAPDTAGKWRVTDLPDPAGRAGSETFVGGSGLYIVKGHNTDKALIADFLKAFAQSELAIYKDSGIFTGYLPDYDDPVFEEKSAFFGGQKYNAFILEQARKVPKDLKNYPPEWREAQDIAEQGLVPFFAGQKSAEQAVSDLEKRLQSLK